MAQGREEFERQLQELGLEVDSTQAENRVAFKYMVPGGRFVGQEIDLGFEVPPDFPRNPPGGPHVRPRLLPMNPSAPDHPNRTADSSFGGEWQYWSRPYRGWKGRKTVAQYLLHVNHLFETT